MQIRPTREDRAFAAEIYRRYKAKPGSEHIATEVALIYLSACLRIYRPRTVVEFGAGIGTMTDALLSHPCGVERVISTEHDKFCLGELAYNLRHHDRSRFQTVTIDRQCSFFSSGRKKMSDDSALASPGLRHYSSLSRITRVAR
jgi:hypothetical protein